MQENVFQSFRKKYSSSFDVISRAAVFQPNLIQEKKGLR